MELLDECFVYLMHADDYSTDHHCGGNTPKYAAVRLQKQEEEDCKQENTDVYKAGFKILKNQLYEEGNALETECKQSLC